jgi:hypothetical protein
MFFFDRVNDGLRYVKVVFIKHIRIVPQEDSCRTLFIRLKEMRPVLDVSQRNFKILIRQSVQ